MKIICGEKCEEDSDVVIAYQEILNTTTKAVLLETEGREVWLPFSQIVHHDEGEKTLQITDWIAGEKGLEGV